MLYDCGCSFEISFPKLGATHCPRHPMSERMGWSQFGPGDRERPY